MYSTAAHSLALTHSKTLLKCFRKTYHTYFLTQKLNSLMSMLNEILESYPDDSFLKADGFDDAVIGLDEQSMRLVYSVSKCIAILRTEGMTEEDALEHFSFNVSGAYVGDQTPIWCNDSYDLSHF